MTFNKLIFKNLTGTQTITTSSTGIVTLAGASPYIQVDAAGFHTIGCPIAGSVNWQKRGNNTLRLTAANTFSGGMTITAGTVEIANASALGTGTVTMTGGKLSSSSTTGYSLANALTLNGTMTLGDGSNTGVLTFAGTTTVSGTTTLTASVAVGVYGSFQGSGAFSYGGNNIFIEGTANNTYSGAFTIRDGFVVLAANAGSATPNQLGTGSVTLNGGALEIRGNNTHTFTNTISGVSGAVIYVRNTSAAGITFNGSMASYTGSLRAYADSVEGANPVQKITLTRADQFGFASFWFQSGGGLTTLSQTLNYTGSGAVSTSAPIVLYLPGTNSFTATYSNNSSNNSGITHSNVVEFNGFAGGNATFRLQATSGPFTFNAAIYDFDYGATGKLSVVKEGTYAATFAGGNNGYRGSVAVNQGTFNANNATALGLATSTAGITVTSGATLSLGAAATYASRTLAIGGTGVSSTVGALVVNHTGTSTFGSIQLGSPTNYIRATASGLLDAAFTPGGNSLILGAAAGVDFFPFGSSLARVFSGTGSVTYGSQAADSGTVLTGTSHNYTGNTTLAYGTVYAYSASEAPGTEGPFGRATTAGSLLMTGGTLFYANGSYDYSGRFSTAGGQQWKINTGSSSVTFATNLVGASSLSLLGGALTLTGSSTFSSGVTLAGGTLNVGSVETNSGGISFAGPLGLTGAIAFTGGTLQYSSVNQFDYAFRFATTAGQSFKIDTNGQDVTFSSALTSSGGSLTKVGTGKLTLGVANSYSNGSTLTNGTLKCNNAASLGTGGLAQASGTVLHVATVDGKMTIQGAHTNTGSGSRTIRIGA